jgi:septum formation protein
MDIILASTSPYRRQLLERLQIPFICEAPDADESPLPGEDPGAMAGRLAMAKARSVAARHPTALVIGSDQVASIAGGIIGKPGTHAAARAQLLASSGNTVHFYTGLALVGTDSGVSRSCLETFSVTFRNLGAQEIEGYLKLEQPYDCAGSFKCEGLGIALFEKMQGNDPTALEGLPLIATSTLLREVGVNVLGS